MEEFSRNEYEEDPYNLLLLTLGGEVEVNGEFINVSEEIWYLDTECIEDHGDYARIIIRLENMTKLNLNKYNGLRRYSEWYCMGLFWIYEWTYQMGNESIWWLVGYGDIQEI